MAAPDAPLPPALISHSTLGVRNHNPRISHQYHTQPHTKQSQNTITWMAFLIIKFGYEKKKDDIR